MNNKPDNKNSPGLRSKLPSLRVSLLLFVVLSSIAWSAGGDELVKRLYRKIKPCPAKNIITEKIEKDLINMKKAFEMRPVVPKEQLLVQYMSSNSKLFEDGALVQEAYALFDIVLRSEESHQSEMELASLLLRIQEAHEVARVTVQYYENSYGVFPHQNNWALHQYRYNNLYLLKEEYFQRKNNNLELGARKIAPNEITSLKQGLVLNVASDTESVLVNRFMTDVNQLHHDAKVSVIEVIMALIAEKERSGDADHSDISNGVVRKDFVKGLGRFLHDEKNDCDDFAMALSQSLDIFGEEALIVDLDPMTTRKPGHWINAMKLSDYPYTIGQDAITFVFKGDERVLIEPQKVVKKVCDLDGLGVSLKNMRQNNCFTKENFKDGHFSPYITIIDDERRHEIDLCYCLGEPGKK